MTQEEADKIASAIATADGGCSTCVQGMCQEMTEANLGFSFAMGDRMIERQPSWSDDPEDAQSYPEVIATPTPAPAAAPQPRQGMR